MSDTEAILRERLQNHLQFIYPNEASASLVSRIFEIFPAPQTPPAPGSSWSERDSVIITYGDTLTQPGESPLSTLDQFLERRVGDAVSSVHILPFCPFSSDDGFSVIDYLQINPDLGDWNDVSRIADRYRLMADLVINHTSAESEWFQNFLEGKSPGRDYFITVDQEEDLTDVVRPRASPLLRTVQTADGLKSVWCTFSHDQIDVNFRNPDVLLEFLQIIRRYLDAGVQIIRLDAIGYLWKEIGTSCIHLQQTHEVVRLLRTIVDYFAPGTVLITETNVPNRENLTYFGNSNEAHMIYNFSLAPLVLHALLAGTSKHLKTWMMSMPPAPIGCTYLNFTASHDGIGMRPAEGLLTDLEQQEMVETIRRSGGLFSTRRLSDGSEKIYEVNTSLFDALKETNDGPDDYQVDRFICSQTVMMSLEGIPAFYIHSLLATPNDHEGVERTGRARSINRKQIAYPELQTKLDDESSATARVFRELVRRIRIRSEQPAFHPNATQFTLHLKSHFFGFWRQSMDRQQSIFCVSNLSAKRHTLQLSQLNLIATDTWHDLISGRRLNDKMGTIAFAPYQTVWITNRPTDK
ncbi:sugar phosphorylase [Rubinisphaera margarita]|uniref:sugar phosphorylase n=1 Tax=Rubinisphaera margarita TaxID=2909586 RepID=UPI001EE98F6F|nr:sugar phosphorylase [Rubinisphaera margarita]MCG6154401.1 sugar phosphorylase [Rubinisphaera margarita]